MNRRHVRTGVFAVGAALALTAASAIGVSSLSVGADPADDIVVTSCTSGFIWKS